MSMENKENALFKPFAIDKSMLCDNGLLASKLIVFENKIFYVVGANTRKVFLSEAVVSNSDGIMIVEAVYRFGAFVDIDHRATPCSVTAVVEEVVFYGYVVDRSAFQPSKRVRLELDRGAAAVKVISRDFDVAFCGDKHSASSVITNDIVSYECVRLVG